MWIVCPITGWFIACSRPCPIRQLINKYCLYSSVFFFRLCLLLIAWCYAVLNWRNPRVVIWFSDSIFFLFLLNQSVLGEFLCSLVIYTLVLLFFGLRLRPLSTVSPPYSLSCSHKHSGTGSPQRAGFGWKRELQIDSAATCNMQFLICALST